jgi:hypothetical protein
MRTLYLATAFAVVLTVSLLGFRGRSFTHPPMDVFPEWAFPGMKYQPKLVQQTESSFFADGLSDRVAPPNTVPSSYGPAGQPLRNDNFLYLGKAPDGSFASRQGRPEAPRARPRPVHDLLLALPRRRRRRQWDNEEVRDGCRPDVP